MGGVVDSLQSDLQPGRRGVASRQAPFENAPPAGPHPTPPPAPHAVTSPPPDTPSPSAQVRSVAWCPNGDTAIAAATVGASMLLLLPLKAPLPAAEAAAALLDGSPAISGAAEGAEGEVKKRRGAAGASSSADAGEGVAGEGGAADAAGGVGWSRPSPALRAEDAVWEVTHVRSASSVCWHHKASRRAPQPDAPTHAPTPAHT